MTAELYRITPRATSCHETTFSFICQSWEGWGGIRLHVFWDIPNISTNSSPTVLTSSANHMMCSYGLAACRSIGQITLPRHPSKPQKSRSDRKLSKSLVAAVKNSNGRSQARSYSPSSSMVSPICCCSRSDYFYVPPKTGKPYYQTRHKRRHPVNLRQTRVILVKSNHVATRHDIFSTSNHDQEPRLPGTCLHTL